MELMKKVPSSVFSENPVSYDTKNTWSGSVALISIYVSSTISMADA